MCQQHEIEKFWLFPHFVWFTLVSFFPFSYIFVCSWLMTREIICGSSTRNTLFNVGKVKLNCKRCLFLFHGTEIDMLHHLVRVCNSVDNISLFFSSVRKCQYFKSNDNHFRTFVHFFSVLSTWIHSIFGSVDCICTTNEPT